MESGIVLGAQPAGTVPVQKTMHGAPPRDVLRKQTEAVFPKPGKHTRRAIASVIFFATVVTAILLAATAGSSTPWMALLVPVVFGVPAVFLGPVIRAARDRRGRFEASGVVIMTDHAGMVHGDDAQQRALIHVEHNGTVRWLAATQNALFLAEGDRVHVSWASENPDSCYVHDTLTTLN